MVWSWLWNIWWIKEHSPKPASETSKSMFIEEVFFGNGTKGVCTEKHSWELTSPTEQCRHVEQLPVFQVQTHQCATRILLETVYNLMKQGVQGIPPVPSRRFVLVIGGVTEENVKYIYCGEHGIFLFVPDIPKIRWILYHAGLQNSAHLVQGPVIVKERCCPDRRKSPCNAWHAYGTGSETNVITATGVKWYKTFW